MTHIFFSIILSAIANKAKYLICNSLSSHLKNQEIFSERYVYKIVNIFSRIMLIMVQWNYQRNNSISQIFFSVIFNDGQLNKIPYIPAYKSWIKQTHLDPQIFYKM